MNIPDSMAERPELPAFSTLDLIHRWILHRCSQLAEELNDALTDFRFDVGADRLIISSGTNMQIGTLS